MDFQKSLLNVRDRLGQQLAQQIDRQLDKVSLDGLLGVIGLQVFKRRRGMLLPVLASFGAGVAAGALLTPMTGKELRTRLGAMLGQGSDRKERRAALAGAMATVAEGAAGGESPYEKAAKVERDANAPKRAPRIADVPATT